MKKLYTGIKVRLVEFIRNTPPQRSIFAPLLYSAMQVCQRIKHNAPMIGDAYLQEILCNAKIGSREISLDPLRRFVSKFNSDLEKIDREFPVLLCSHPKTELFMHRPRFGY